MAGILHLLRFERQESELPKRPKKPKQSLPAKSRRTGQDWMAVITPVPAAQREPITDNHPVEIDKWLKLVESYWDRNKRRKKA